MKLFRLPALLLAALALAKPAMTLAGLQVSGGTNFSETIAHLDTTPRTLDGTDFGDVTIPGTKTTSFQVKNTGNINETLVLIAVDGAAFTLSSGGLGGGLVNLAPNATWNFSVRFEPVSDGAKSGSVQVLSTTGATVVFDIAGEAIGLPTIAVKGRSNALLPYFSITDGDSTPTDPDGTDFGSRSLDAGSLTHTFQITNTGTGQLDIDSITENSAHFSITGAPSVVGVNQTQTFSVKYTPTTLGDHSAVVTLQNNVAGFDPFTFTVKGTGTGPEIQLLGGSAQTVNIANGDTTPSTTDSTDFGTVVAGSPDVIKTFKIKNNGNAPMLVSSITDDAIAFSITNAPQPLVPINPGASVNFNVVLSTTVAGTKYGTVTVISNAPNAAVFDFDVTAEATGTPEIEVAGRSLVLNPYISITDGATVATSPNGTDFGSFAVGSSQLQRTFQITNSGKARLNIDSISETSPHFSITGAPTSVAVGATQTFVVNFHPTSIGAKSTTITLQNDDPNEDPFTFVVAGTGTGGVVAVGGGTAFGVDIINGDTTPQTADGTQFGSLVVGGNISKSFRIFNRGNAALLFNAVTEDGAAFSISSPPSAGSSIPANGSADFSVVFAPTAAGAKQATVTVLTGDPVTPAYTFDVAGTADGAALLEVRGPSLAPGVFTPIPNGASSVSTGNGTDFGTRSVSASALSRTFQLVNTGTAQLAITSIISSNAMFTVSNIPAVVGVNQTGNFTIAFDPTSYLGYRSKITVTTNANADQTYTFYVEGIGSAGDLSIVCDQGNGDEVPAGDITPSTDEGTDYGTLEAGKVLGRDFTLFNLGNAPLIVNVVSQNGTAWRLAGTPSPGSSIPAGGSAQFTLYLEPISAGLKNATVTVATNDPDHPLYTFAVTGLAEGSAGIAVSGRSLAVAPLISVPDGSTTSTSVNGTGFGTVNVTGGEATHTFRITNTGNDQLVITSYTQASPHFIVTDVPATVPVGATRDFSVTFDPNSGGVKTTELTLTSNAPGNAADYTFQLQGTGEAPDISLFGGINFGTEIQHGDLTPRTADGTNFGALSVSGSSKTNTFQLKNVGQESLVILAGVSSNAAFTLSGLPGPTGPMATNDTDDFTITFDPTASGPISATIILQTNDPDEPNFTFAVNGVGSSTGNAIQISGQAGILTSGGAPISLGTTTVSTQIAATFSIENTGDAPLTVSGISESSAQFNLQNATVPVLAPGASHEFRVRGSAAAAGTYSTSVTVTSDASNTPSFVIPVQFTATATPPALVPDIEVYGGQNLDIPIADGDVTTREQDGTFAGVVELNQTLTRVFRIRNAGTGTLTLSPATFDPFNVLAVQNLPASLAAGQFVDITITGNPYKIGDYIGTLTIPNSDPDEGPYTFAFDFTVTLPVFPLAILDSRLKPNGDFEMMVISNPNRTYRLGVTNNLQNWQYPFPLTQGNAAPTRIVIPRMAQNIGSRGFTRLEVFP